MTPLQKKLSFIFPLWVGLGLAPNMSTRTPAAAPPKAFGVQLKLKTDVRAPGMPAQSLFCVAPIALTAGSPRSAPDAGAGQHHAPAKASGASEHEGGKPGAFSCWPSCRSHERRDSTQTSSWCPMAAGHARRSPLRTQSRTTWVLLSFCTCSIRVYSCSLQAPLAVSAPRTWGTGVLQHASAAAARPVQVPPPLICFCFRYPLSASAASLL